MKSVAVTSRFALMVLGVSLLFLVVLCPTSSRAGEGGPETSPAEAKAEVSKPCFTLLNADKLPADATPEARLNAARVKVDWSHADGITLQQVLTELGRTIDLPIIFLPGAKKIFEAWEQYHFNPNEIFPIDGTLQNISARGYLDYVFYSIDEELWWKIHDGKVIIRTLEETPGGIGMLQNRVYRLGKLGELGSDLPGGGGSGPGLLYSENLITELITCTIDPESWLEVGGAGAIATMELAGAKVLVVRNFWDVQEQIAALIDTIEQMLDAKELVVERSLNAVPAENVKQAMHKKITLDVEEMPLSKFLAELGKQAGISILLDQRSLEELGYSVDTPITYRCKEKPLRLVEDCLWPLELTWVSRFGVLEVTTQEEAEQNLSTSVFEVTDLTKWAEYKNFDMDSLISLTTDMADPESWQEVGGPGTIYSVCFKKYNRSFLVIRQTESVMEEIRQLLAGLRTIRDKKNRRFSQVSKADREVCQKLNEKLKWDIEEGMTLVNVLAELEKRLDIMTRVDVNALECLGFDQHSFKLGPIRANDFSASSLLSLLLEPNNMDWGVLNGELLISTQEEFEYDMMSVVLYEVGDLTPYADTQGHVFHDFDSLIELVTNTVDPESWQEVGGPGCIDCYSLGEKKVLAVRQTYRAHQEVAQLLADLRAAMPKDLAKRVLPVRSEPLFQGTSIPAEGPEVGNEKKLPENLPPLHSKQGALVEANNAFAVKLYGQMAREQDRVGQGDGVRQEGQRVVRRKSFCFSPYCIAALTQTIKAGTRGETDRELAEALCLTTLAGDDLHGAYGSLLTSLMSDLFQGCYTPGPGTPISGPFPHIPRNFDLTIANRLWIQEESNAKILPEFKQRLAKQYLAGVEETDFVGKGPESARRINDWVGQQTRGRIEGIISPDDFNELTRFVAVNAVFFQGRWLSPFSPSKTRPKPFYDSDGKTKLGEVPMMSMSRGTYRVGTVDGVSIFRKPYHGDASFFVLLPPPGEGELEKLEASLSGAKLRKWVTAAESQLLTKLEIPKFELESTFPLIDVMKRLGVKELFDENGADFSGMVPPDSDWAQDPLFIYLMRHKATIKVDEVGTVATGAGMMGGMGGGMIEPKPQEFIANRPFLFLIFDEKTSSLLFMGRYAGPEENTAGQVGGFF